MSALSSSQINEQCPLTEAETAQSIISTILADVNAIMPNFSSLVSSYRLLVGAAEEIHRIPDVCPDVFERAVRRFDNAGTLIDILLDLLCCKITFSSEFLEISCLPVDLFRLLANHDVPCDQSHRTAEQIIALEALRQSLLECRKFKCFPDKQVVCPSPPPAPTPPVSPASTAPAAPLSSSPVSVFIRTDEDSADAEKPRDLQPEINEEPVNSIEQNDNDSSLHPPLETTEEIVLQTEIPVSTIQTAIDETPIKSSVRRRHI